MMLVLFDVDKTLFLTSDQLMGQAATDAIETVWGLKLPGDAIRRVDHPGASQHGVLSQNGEFVQSACLSGLVDVEKRDAYKLAYDEAVRGLGHQQLRLDTSGRGPESFCPQQR